MGNPRDNFSPVYDVVGIGFGPANLALAIALEEHNDSAPRDQAVTALFLERQPSFGWHRGMLIDGATMQVSFLKDLATLRNPTSRFGFVPYLHARGRLVDFINHKILYPTREEFHDYLEWAAAGVDHLVSYSSEVTEVRAAGDLLEVVVQGPGGSTVHRARNVVVACGLRPRMPDGVKPGANVWHSSELLTRLAGRTADARRFVVVGAGQSAAEAAEYLHRTYPQAEVQAVFARYGYSPADDSPYANRVFDPEAVDVYYDADQDAKDRLMAYHRNTNYAVVDLDLIEELYRRAYQEKVRGQARLHIRGVSEVTDVRDEGTGVTLRIRSQATGTEETVTADAAVFATGYDEQDPVPLLGPLAPYVSRDTAGRLRIGRDYRLSLDGPGDAGIYVQGGTEHTHGITSSLLSMVAVRSGEILRSVLEHRDAAKDRDDTALALEGAAHD
ncbi:lysine N(6)-hydroxylase/L-ornithine N(5)-oxygenase family protein [Streptomyces sp. FXJ1.172]|uniref:lysine N(6)-hydroxylase/L-ornithine N(5)-oxygenase family protein n=1 Tax=Streptomyces sp. FXJ1.172 TaxID=710705 RepID=UPI0007D04045|nr:lysine N(6)-hydroxylase/L-ornithine N(5)-oxygenase family protein [Streptomyces sp. FXJ1.172]WEO95172.1 lysine N(6)-hydroxylase/L-ornithine N(5)-oxygenase family protein [Streptomyces sp. FXJ1.172]